MGNIINPNDLKIKLQDLHGAWEKFTGHHSALYGRSDETDALQKTLNVDFAVNYWINNGFPREKINMGMATYGRAFTLDSSGDNDLGSTATGAGTAGTVEQFSSLWLSIFAEAVS